VSWAAGITSLSTSWRTASTTVAARLALARGQRAEALAVAVEQARVLISR
jgi:hypothetical protein